MSENLGGPNLNSDTFRQTNHVTDFSEKTETTSHVDNTVNNSQETEIVHLGRRTQNDHAVITHVGKRPQRALWDSGAVLCKAVLTLCAILFFISLNV